ncbi:MAG: ABC transporter ATP-binding protein [Candidatus Omnitrophica bacterium]|jgi:ABC-type dipeptide/oligopeptide/nickel transport system ATPase component|nr:ABC transporter ATP-binding protein [Candidatus Omnitrophota bacterium]
MILEVKNLSVSYQTKEGFTEALDKVSFELKEGEILGLVGESGCGKSTFAYSVLDLLSQDTIKKGEIIFDRENIFNLSPKDLENLRANKIGLIFQEPASTFNPVLSIEYQFREILKNKLKIRENKKIEKIILEALDKVRLPDAERIIKSYPHQLSGGQLQRVAIAMAISLGPKILIADEPTSSLDVTIESQIVNLFKDLKEQLNLTIIFITHNLDLVKALCDRVVVLYQGRVLEISDVKELFINPKDSYTKELLVSLKEIEE